MISINLIPQDTKVTIEIPREMVNKHVQVVVREEYEVSPQEEDIEKLRDFFKPFQRDMSSFRMERDELHER